MATPEIAYRLYFSAKSPDIEALNVKPILILLSLVMVSGCRPASRQVAPSEEQTATSSVSIAHDGDATFPVTDNARYYVDPEYRLDGDKSVKLEILEHLVTQVRNDRECCSATVSASGTVDGKPVWTIKKNASQAEIFGRFYRTTTPGCCGSLTRYAYFDPLTGTEAFVTTEPLAYLSVVESYSLSRYLALLDLNGPGDDQMVIRLQYGPQSGPTQTKYLIRNQPETGPHKFTMRYRHGTTLTDGFVSDEDGTYPNEFTLFPAGYPANRDGSTSDITGFSYVLSWQGEHESVEIPVIHDHLDFQHAKLPRGFSFVDTPPADYAKYLEEMLQR